jgi:geranylgeranyl reductase family protein
MVGSMKKYEVIVVGAGPAGSTAAKYLAERKLSVLLLDAETFPRDKPCGGGMPTRVQKRFPYIEPFIDSISYGSITYSSSLRYRLTIVREYPLMMTVLRKTFDHQLVQLACQAGVKFQDNRTVIDVSVRPTGVLVMLKDGETIEADVVVGCDGMRSVVAEKTNLCKKLESLCISLMQEQPLTPKQLDTFYTKKRLVHLFIKAHGVAGYGWVFPKKHCVNLGIGEFQSALPRKKPKASLKESFEAFITLLKEQHLLPEDFRIENLRGATLPIFPLENTYRDRVLLCGDAAGFINPITGEGIYYAMSSGQIAAKVIAEAFHSHDFSKRFLARYQRAWKKDFGNDLKILGVFNYQWGRNSERIVRMMTEDKKFAKLIVGVSGGQISFSKYRGPIFIRFLYTLLKDFMLRWIRRSTS